MRNWPVHDAKSRFSELLDATLAEGPQMLTRRGVETAVIVPVGEWRRLAQAGRPTLKELLLAPAPRCDELAPRRGRLKRRRPSDLA
jgi:prevent-host-death family protein